MIEWHFLNFGSKKLKASIDTDVRITGVKTLHIGHAMSFVVNQREGLQGLCLKAGSVLLNVSENLSMAFFWPKKPTNLELVEDRDLSNGEQWLSSYPESVYDIDLETEDLVENVLPIYHDTKDDERQDIVAGLNEKWRNSYAITELYDTAEKAQASCAWKFDHWRQFDYTDLDRVEFCFKPVFKLDRIKEYIHTNVGGDIQKTSEGYSENPNRDYRYGVQPDYSRHGPIRDTWDGHYYYDTDAYRETTREEHFADTPGWYADGSIPTVDYYQIANRFEWYYNYVGDTVIHYCSHETRYSGGWSVGADWNPYYGSRTTTLKGKEVVGPGNMDIDDMIPGFREAAEKSHPSKYYTYEIRNISGYAPVASKSLTFSRYKYRGVGRVVPGSELKDSTLVYHRSKNPANIAKDIDGGSFNKGYGSPNYYIDNLTCRTVTAADLPEPDEALYETITGQPSFEVWYVYFTPVSVKASDVNPSNIRAYLDSGAVLLVQDRLYTKVNGFYSFEKIAQMPQEDGSVVKEQVDGFRYGVKFDGADFEFDSKPLSSIDTPELFKSTIEWFENVGVWQAYNEGKLGVFSHTERLATANGKNLLFFDFDKQSASPYGIRFHNDLWEGRCLGNTTEMLDGWTYNDRLSIGSFFGARSYCISANGRPNGSAYIDFPAELYAGKSVRWSGYMAGWAGQNERANTGLYALDQNKNILTSTSTYAGGGSWQSRSLSISLPSNTYYIRVRLWQSNPEGNADGYWTNMTLTVPEDGTVARPSDGPFYVKDENYNMIQLSDNI